MKNQREIYVELLSGKVLEYKNDGKLIRLNEKSGLLEVKNKDQRWSEADVCNVFGKFKAEDLQVYVPTFTLGQLKDTLISMKMRRSIPSFIQFSSHSSPRMAVDMGEVSASELINELQKGGQ